MPASACRESRSLQDRTGVPDRAGPAQPGAGVRASDPGGWSRRWPRAAPISSTRAAPFTDGIAGASDGARVLPWSRPATAPARARVHTTFVYTRHPVPPTPASTTTSPSAATSSRVCLRGRLRHPRLLRGFGRGIAEIDRVRGDGAEMPGGIIARKFNSARAEASRSSDGAAFDDVLIMRPSDAMTLHGEWRGRHADRERQCRAAGRRRRQRHRQLHQFRGGGDGRPAAGHRPGLGRRRQWRHPDRDREPDRRSAARRSRCMATPGTMSSPAAPGPTRWSAMPAPTPPTTRAPPPG